MKRIKISLTERLKIAIVRAFHLLYPFIREFEEQTTVIRAETIEMSELTILQKASSEAIVKLAKALLTQSEYLEALTEKQAESNVRMNVVSMKLKEIEKDPKEIGELLSNAATIIANWHHLIKLDPDLLVGALSAPLPETRKEALKRIPQPLLDDWHTDILEVIENHDAQSY